MNKFVVDDVRRLRVRGESNEVHVRARLKITGDVARLAFIERLVWTKRVVIFEDNDGCSDCRLLAHAGKQINEGRAELFQVAAHALHRRFAGIADRSEEHTSELQSHSFISYAVFCLKKKR